MWNQYKVIKMTTLLFTQSNDCDWSVSNNADYLLFRLVVGLFTLDKPVDPLFPANLWAPLLCLFIISVLNNIQLFVINAWVK